MILRPPLNDGLYRHYVHTLCISPATHRHYYSALRRFQRFLATHSTPDSLSQALLVAWLQQMSAELSLERTIDYGRKLDGFLSWLVDRGLLSANPWGELRTCYGQRLAPIVRALLAPDPSEALDALRPLPAFGSHLGPAMQQYVAYKQGLGFRYESETTRLRRFDRYLQRRPGADQQPLHVLVHEYAERGPTPESRFERLQSGRNLARGLQRYDPSIVVPTLDRFIVQEVVRQRRRPYSYSADEIRRLFAVALTIPSPRAPLRPLTLYTALVLAYGAGLRLGELVRLTVGDVDLEAGLLDIRESKLFKSRRLPLTASVLAALHRYLAARRHVGGASQPTSALLWNEKKGHGYKEVTLETLLTTVIRQAGLKPASGRIGPRLHDLRHTFVCHRMLQWYQGGVDVESRLPYLATYLGHKDINSTLVYLTVTQDLLHQANERFRAIGAHVLHTH
jgi:integrase